MGWDHALESDLVPAAAPATFFQWHEAVRFLPALWNLFSLAGSMTLEIQTGEPSEEGRYVVWTPCQALQAREWCEPRIATWQGGRWHSYDPIWAWVGPLPVVHGNDCLKKIREYDL